MMCANGPLTASQIYKQVHGGPGPAKLIDGQEACTQLQMRLSDRAKQVQDLGGAIADGWQGNAGAAAASAATPLATAAQHDADLLVTADQAMSDQANAFEVIKGKVVPVPPNPPMMTSEDVKGSVLVPDTSGYITKVAQWQAQSQANVDAFAAYHGSSTSNGQTMPTVYAPLVDPGGSISMAESPGGTDGFKGGSGERPPGGTGDGIYSAPPPQAPGGSGPQPHVEPPPGSSPAPNGVSDNTRAASNIPTTDNPGNQQQFRPNPPSTPNAPNNPNTPGLFPGSPGYRGPGTPGGLRTGGFGPGTGGPGGPAGGRAGGPGGVSSGPGGRMTGVGGPERAAGRPGAGGAPGTGGRQGGVPLGGAPMGGRGNKEEDKEHQRAPYVKGEDPEELFGGDIVKPVPQTIGENKPPRKP